MLWPKPCPEVMGRGDMEPLKVSVVIPAYNCEATIAACLESVFASSLKPHEVIVVDDASTDRTAKEARRFPIRLLATDRNRGVGYCRDLGGRKASGEVLFYTDADVVLQPETIARGLTALRQQADAAAVIGSYTDKSGPTNFASRYKQLVLHFLHQTAHDRINTFAGCCGMITRRAFLEVGGFNRTLFNRVCEDVDLGARLYKRNHRIILEKSMQVTHWKKYTVLGLIHNDAIKRAIPWTHIILFHRTINFNLCTRVSDLASLAACNLTVLLLMLLLISPASAPLALLTGLIGLCTAAFMISNRQLFALFYRVYGGRFLMQGMAMRHAYYLISAWGSVLGLLTYPFMRPEGGRSRPLPAGVPLAVDSKKES